jgi:hypothetical protein
MTLSTSTPSPDHLAPPPSQTNLLAATSQLSVIRVRLAIQKGISSVSILSGAQPCRIISLQSAMLQWRRMTAPSLAKLFVVPVRSPPGLAPQASIWGDHGCFYRLFPFIEQCRVMDKQIPVLSRDAPSFHVDTAIVSSSASAAHQHPSYIVMPGSPNLVRPTAYELYLHFCQSDV